MCLIPSVGNPAHGSSQCWHTVFQNVFLRNCSPLLWNKYKTKTFLENRQEHLLSVAF